ncbi:MAG TPA: hypothetical protein VFW05_07890 [Verrucomicrobiae bacterium]|jgi:flagellar motility protein MotE (MotC chaperone)|nr:hypothetical protein [Verrucomicrobiae bacterium]
MIRILQSSWMTALAGGLVYLGVTFALLSPAKFEGARAAQAETDAAKSPNDDPSWRFRNPEMEQWLNELKHEKEALELRAQQLQELAARLESDRKELNVVTQTVYQLQTEFDKNVVRIKEQEADNLKREVKILSNMSPDAAAALIREMPEDEAVKVLFLMKNDATGGILASLSQLGPIEAQRAANLMEKLRRTLPPEPKTTAKSF